MATNAETAETAMALIPVLEVTEVTIIRETLSAWANAPEWQHIRAISAEADTTDLVHEVYLISDAKIPSMTIPASENEIEPEDSRESKELSVEMLSGDTAQVQVSGPCTAAHVKRAIEIRLGVPSCMQRLIAGSEELSDEAMVTMDSVTMLRRDPPAIATGDFLRTMIRCPGYQERGVFRGWYEVASATFGSSIEAGLERVMAYQNMRNVPLTTEHTLACLDAWLRIENKAGTHPDSFRVHVDKMVAFMQHCCYSPSLLAYEELAQTTLVPVFLLHKSKRIHNCFRPLGYLIFSLMALIGDHIY